MRKIAPMTDLPHVDFSFGLTLACAMAVGVLLRADRVGQVALRAVAKVVASSCFVGVAVSLGGLASPYGQLIVLALALGWLGDALLLSARPVAFLLGLGAFLLSHLCFAVAFVREGVVWPVVGLAMVPALALGAGVLRWLWPHLSAEFKLPVLAYIVTILCMCAAATGLAMAQASWGVLLGALLFAASDVSVARDQFVAPGHANRLWGWPTYFAAQLLLAWTVLAHRAAGGL
jgi:uncharacterized membrane protein YhhN